MATAPNTSFIPKQGPAKRNRQAISRQVHLFTIFSYLLFSATLIATVGVFFYSRHIEGIQVEQVKALNDAINGYSETKMEQVLSFHSRLEQAKNRLDSSVSTASILSALDEATVQTVEIENLTLKRNADTGFTLEAELKADSFDSALFQRNIFERNDVIESVDIRDLQIDALTSGQGDAARVEEGVTFVAQLGVPLSAVPYEATVSTPSVVSEPVSTSSAPSSDSVVDSNQTQL